MQKGTGMCGLPWRPSTCGVPEASNVWKCVKVVLKRRSVFLFFAIHGLGRLRTPWMCVTCWLGNAILRVSRYTLIARTGSSLLAETGVTRETLFLQRYEVYFVGIGLLR